MSRGFSQVAIGFNWAYASGPAEAAFWRRLGRSGGALFRRSVDWVGLDVYPGTWGPRIAGRDLEATTAKTMLASLGALRHRLMPLAGLPSSVPIHVSETGYPTGLRRTEAMQVNVMQASIAAVYADRSRLSHHGLPLVRPARRRFVEQQLREPVRANAGRLHAEGRLRGVRQTRSSARSTVGRRTIDGPRFEEKLFTALFERAGIEPANIQRVRWSVPGSNRRRPAAELQSWVGSRWECWS